MPKLTRHYAHWPKGVPHTLETPDRHLFSFLEDSAKAAPDKTAIYYYGRQISFRQLHQASLNLAGYLQQHLGVRRGDRVLLLMQNCPQFAIAYYAILRCDAVVVAMSPMSTAEEVGHYAEDSGARVLLASQELLANALPLLDDGRLEACIVSAPQQFAGQPHDVPFMDIPEFVREPRRAQNHPRLHELADALQAGLTPGAVQNRGSDLAILGYTSGTTGKPKGAMLLHSHLILSSLQRSIWMPEGDDYISLSVLPVSHLAGMSILNQAMLTTGSLVMLSRWDCNAVVELIERLRITSVGVVTPMVAEMFARDDINRRDLSSIRRIYGGATAMPEALAAAIEQRLGIAFVEGYGMTESCGGSHVNPPDAARRQCGGIAQINVDARIIDPDTGVELGPNQPGEIVINSPTVFSGYWNRPQATLEAFIELDGKPFLRTGDIGYFDDDGYFYITDRLKRMINASGLKVWPAEIETALYAHPAVQEACVISAFDPKRGETVKALVILRPAARGTLQEAELGEWARTRMAAYKVPRIIEFVDCLPKTNTGKTLWRELQREQDERDRALRPAPLPA
ncbi:AMP-binding protein [Pseudomonas sp. H9]|uniref:AMP-binding protein n=1 Tax=Pseudomonas sp. H9 TaxID=483968 RepID=UPI0010576C83|nr:AMP-binding protein [Pseudomonas sp. H9]TDF83820.1 long-chain-fatty-acid--CoA ligase LcfA [Pseudomonas sp. H9]